MRSIAVVLLLLLVSGQVRAQTGSAPTPEGQNVLTALVAELEQRNPELAAARRDVEVRAARVKPAGAPPDPILSVGYMSGYLRPPFFPSSATPDAFRQIAITQELPFPGTLGLRERVAATDVDTARWSAEATRVRLISDLKAAYIDYVLAARTLEIVDRNRRALEQFRGVAEARFAVGRATQQDVFRAQLEISALLERTTVLSRDRSMLQARINRLLNRATDTPVPVAEPVELAADLSIDDLRARAAEAYPAAKRDTTAITRSEQALSLAKRERRPDLGIRFSTQKFVGGMPWMYGLDFMVSVPVFWNRKQQPMVAEAAAALEVARNERDDTLAEAIGTVAEEHAALMASRTLIELYGDSILPQARLTLESSLASYEVGAVDFLTVITNFIAVLNYETGLEEQRARLRQALSRIEPLTGIALLR